MDIQRYATQIENDFEYIIDLQTKDKYVSDKTLAQIIGITTIEVLYRIITNRIETIQISIPTIRGLEETLLVPFDKIELVSFQR